MSNAGRIIPVIPTQPALSKVEGEGSLFRELFVRFAKVRTYASLRGEERRGNLILDFHKIVPILFPT